MKKIRLIIIAIMLLASSGCFFPVYVPVGGGHEGHHGEHR